MPINRADPSARPVHQRQIAIFTDVAGLQSEKMPKRGTQGTR